MTTRIFIFSAIVLTLASCSGKNDPILRFDPNQTTTIEYRFTNVTTPLHYTYFYNQALPNKQISDGISIFRDTTFTKTYDINHPTTIVAFIDNDDFQCFALPNDTLIAEIVISNSGDTHQDVIFNGKTANISKYITETSKHFYGAPRYNETAESFYNTLDSFYHRELVVLDSLVETAFLPKWFYPYQKEYIEHERDHFKLIHYPQRLWFYNDFIPDSNRKQPNINLKNLNFIWQDQASYMLSNIHEAKFDTLLTPEKSNNEIFQEYLQNNINQLSDKIPENEMSFITASTISSIFSKPDNLRLSLREFGNLQREIDDIIKKNQYLITDSVHLITLEAAKQKFIEEYNNQIKLSSGDKAPSFFLKNRQNVTQKLSQYEGKVLFLNFWATYCGGCIKTIPEKNLLCEK